MDEVLAVGDMIFQQKCLGKMKEVSRSGGRTVLFVSHNMGAIQSLCHNAMVLKGGRIAHLKGPTEEAVRSYLRRGNLQAVVQDLGNCLRTEREARVPQCATGGRCGGASGPLSYG